MENIKIETFQNVDIDFKLAGIGDRILARLLDFLILMFYGFFIVIILGFGIGSRFDTGIVIMMVLLYIPIFFYPLIFETFFNGQTPGKMALKIKVVGIDGSPPKFSAYFLRWLLGLFEIMMTYGLAAILAIVIGGKGQRLGDMLGKTTVVKVNKDADIDDTIFKNIENYELTFPEAENLSEEEVNLIQELINRNRESYTSDVVKTSNRRLKNKLEKKLGIQVSGDPVWFFDTLMKDYNYIKGKL